MLEAALDPRPGAREGGDGLRRPTRATLVGLLVGTGLALGAALGPLVSAVTITVGVETQVGEASGAMPARSRPPTPGPPVTSGSATSRDRGTPTDTEPRTSAMVLIEGDRRVASVTDPEAGSITRPRDPAMPMHGLRRAATLAPSHGRGRGVPAGPTPDGREGAGTRRGSRQLRERADTERVRAVRAAGSGPAPDRRSQGGRGRDRLTPVPRHDVVLPSPAVRRTTRARSALSATLGP
jgi:hypothetical protein